MPRMYRASHDTSLIWGPLRARFRSNRFAIKLGPMMLMGHIARSPWTTVEAAFWPRVDGVVASIHLDG